MCIRDRDNRFEIRISDLGHYTANGRDAAEIYIAVNPGEALRPLASVASGGELSRIMLAVKTVLADEEDTPTLIFDEIDTGISGITAGKVAEKMRAVSDTHLDVYKRQVEVLTKQAIELLKEMDTEDSSVFLEQLLKSLVYRKK